MVLWFSHIIDRLSDYFAARKGLLPLLGIILIIGNIILQFIPGLGWLAHTNLLLSLGAIIAIVGIMLAWAL